MKQAFLTLTILGILTFSCTGRGGKKENISITKETSTETNNTPAVSVSEILLITDHSVDGVVVGEKISEFVPKVQQRYSVKKETINLEGEDYDIYNVYEDGGKLYSVEPDFDNPDIIYRIWIYDSKFKTKEGIGVHSTLAEIKSKYHIESINIEEGLSLFVKEISVSFIPDASQLPEDWWEKADYEKLPENLLIKEIIIY